MAASIYPNMSEMSMSSPTPRSRLPSTTLEECSESESGTLSGSENGAASDFSSEHCEEQLEEAKQCNSSPSWGKSSKTEKTSSGESPTWRKALLRAKQLEQINQGHQGAKQQENVSPDDCCSSVTVPSCRDDSSKQEERWRVAGSRLASIFQDHSDSDRGVIGPCAKQPKEAETQESRDAQTQAAELGSTAQQQEQRWRVAGQRLAAIFQDHSDSDFAPMRVRPDAD